MTTAAVYYHFASKTEIIETLSSGVADKVAHFFSLPSESIGSPAEWGTTSVMETLHWMVTDPLEAKFFFVRLAMTHDGAESLGQFRRDTGRLVEFIANSITALDGAIADVEAAVMARALLALVAETARTTLTNRNTAPQNFLQYQQAAAIIASRILTR